MAVRLELPEELEEDIRERQKTIDSLRGEAETIGSPSGQQVRVVTSAVQTAGFEELIIKLDAIEAQVENLREKQSRAIMQISEATEGMSERGRTILTMRYCWLWDKKDIAKALGVSVKTIQRRLEEARKEYYRTSSRAFY